jgi:hypothetical protein
MDARNHRSDADFEQSADIVPAPAEDAFIGAGIAIRGFVGSPSVEYLGQTLHAVPLDYRLRAGASSE